MAGRKPIPAAMIDNSTHKKKSDEIVNRIETESELTTSAILKCPRTLSKEAKKEWRKVVKLYQQLDSKILCDLDATALGIYCEAVVIYNDAHNQYINYTKKILSHEPGDDNWNPLYIELRENSRKIMKEQVKIINTLAEQLCLTPVGRARMGVLINKKKSKTSKLDDLLNEDC